MWHSVHPQGSHDLLQKETNRGPVNVKWCDNSDDGEGLVVLQRLPKTIAKQSGAVRGLRGCFLERKGRALEQIPIRCMRGGGGVCRLSSTLRFYCVYQTLPDWQICFRAVRERKVKSARGKGQSGTLNCPGLGMSNLKVAKLTYPCESDCIIWTGTLCRADWMSVVLEQEPCPRMSWCGPVAAVTRGRSLRWLALAVVGNKQSSGTGWD